MIWIDVISQLIPSEDPWPCLKATGGDEQGTSERECPDMASNWGLDPQYIASSQEDQEEK